MYAENSHNRSKIAKDYVFTNFSIKISPVEVKLKRLSTNLHISAAGPFGADKKYVHKVNILRIPTNRSINLVF